MHVVATAGHVDHGKSTLVRALTGMEPDRWAEEQRRGLTIDLGYAWTTLPGGPRVAFVDVPGHERFVTNMLAGVGPAPAVMLVVAADEGWMPQSEEHLRAVAGLGARHVLVVATKTDLAAPDEALAQARKHVAAAGVTAVAEVAVSATSGAGLADLTAALAGLVESLPEPDVAAPVRLWVDRAFSIRGAGTVVTGTLPAGRLRCGDELALAPSGRPVVVRGLQSLNEEHDEIAAVARVAVNLRGIDRDEVARGMALLTPGAWTAAAEMDVLVDPGDSDGPLPAQVVVHVGSAAVPARLRMLGTTAARLRLARPLPLHLGDRVLVRDPASRRLAGADVADLHPGPLRRRGDAGRVAADLRVPATADDEVARRGMCTDDDLRAAGFAQPPRQAVRVGHWWVDDARWSQLRTRLASLAGEVQALSAGLPLAELRRALDLPDVALVRRLVDEVPGLTCTDGRVRPDAAETVTLPGLDVLLTRLAAAPLAAPEAAELTALGLGAAQLAHAVRQGLLMRLTDGVYVAPTGPEHALAVLSGIGRAFTVAEARELLGSTRRVVVPLLEHLDASRRTQRHPDGRRSVVSRPA
jgi:selenocysteine-specific elongation factor